MRKSLVQTMRIFKVKKSFEVKIEWWEFSSRSQYLRSVPFKILSSIY